MKLSGKKLTTAILAGLMGATMFGGSVFAEVSDQEFNEVRQGVNSNTQRISQLESAQKDAKDYSKDIADHTTAIANEVTARTEADTNLDTRITNVKEYLEKQTAADYVSKTDAAVQDGAVAKAGNTIGENVTNLDGALAKEIAARIGADKAQDKVIEQVNKNVADGFDTINQNVAAGFTALNQADANEAAARDKADQQEAQTRADADSQLNTKMTKGFATIQGQQDEQDAKIADHENRIKANARKIQKNTDDIQANSDKIADHEDRIASNEKNIEAHANTIHKVQSDVVDIQNTLKKADALASADATNAATQAASAATKAADNANKVADGLKDRVDRISYNQDVTSESDLIKKDQSIGQNLTNVDTALHKEIAARIGADKAQDKVIEQVNKNVADGFDTINQNVAAGFTALNQADANEAAARDKADQQEAQTRADADSQLNTKMTKGFATIQGQQDEQNDRIDNHEKRITANAGKIQENTKAIEANSDKLKNHEDRIASNENNIEANANAIHKVQGDVVDNKNAISAEADARSAEDTKLNNKMTSNFIKVQEQLDGHENRIGVNENHIKDNARQIKVNEDNIKTNSDKLKDHEDRIASNENNIEANANAIHKVQGDVVDNKNAISAEVLDRQAADQNLQKQIDNNSTSINDLYGRYSSLKTDINKVGARSAALAGLHPLDFDPANKLNFAVASGSFKGENSVALGAFYRPNENIMFSAASTMGDSDNAYTFGLSFKIGPSSAKTKTTSPDAEELYKVVGQLQDQLAAQQKEIEQLKADKAK